MSNLVTNSFRLSRICLPVCDIYWMTSVHFNLSVSSVHSRSSVPNKAHRCLPICKKKKLLFIINITVRSTRHLHHRTTSISHICYLINLMLLLLLTFSYNLEECLYRFHLHPSEGFRRARRFSRTFRRLVSVSQISFAKFAAREPDLTCAWRDRR